MGARQPVVTADQKRQWADDGYTVLPALFTHRECDELVRYQTALREGRVPPPPGFSPRQREEWADERQPPDNIFAVPKMLMLLVLAQTFCLLAPLVLLACLASASASGATASSSRCHTGRSATTVSARSFTHGSA